MRLHDQVLSEEDFEQLPPALQRKVSNTTHRAGNLAVLVIMTAPENAFSRQQLGTGHRAIRCPCYELHWWHADRLFHKFGGNAHPFTNGEVASERRDEQSGCLRISGLCATKSNDDQPREAHMISYSSPALSTNPWMSNQGKLKCWIRLARLGGQAHSEPQSTPIPCFAHQHLLAFPTPKHTQDEACKLIFVQYFSSLERLRLAQDSSTSKSRKQSQLATSLSASNLSSLRQPSISSSSTDRSFSAGRFPRPPTRSKPYLRKHSQSTISSSTALINPWDFAALPAAIQRKHFSPEEKYLIASRLNCVILDAADEALYKQYQQGPTSDVDHSFDYSIEDIENLDETSSTGEELDEEMDPSDMESLKWLDRDNELDLSLGAYHAVTSNVNNSHPIFSSQRRSFRRGLSFSNISFRRRSSSSSSLPTPQQLGCDSNSVSTVKKDSTVAPDPSSTHYQDPAAKMKLRVYLASPQKFDEALEFGFPSLHREAVQSSGRPKTSSGVVNEQPQTFFADDTPSLSEDESRDELSDHVHHDSPRTPIDMSFPANRPSHTSSIDRAMPLRPRLLSNMGDSYTHAATSDREMTLRMTLTRPEMRALEENDHQTVSINDIPLEKPSLTPQLGGTKTIWDELPEEPSRMKRLFKKLKGRS